MIYRLTHIAPRNAACAHVSRLVPRWSLFELSYAIVCISIEIDRDRSIRATPDHWILGKILEAEVSEVLRALATFGDAAESSRGFQETHSAHPFGELETKPN
jgi:hypothetical protein